MYVTKCLYNRNTVLVHNGFGAIKVLKVPILFPIPLIEIILCFQEYVDVEGVDENLVGSERKRLYARLQSLRTYVADRLH